MFLEGPQIVDPQKIEDTSMDIISPYLKDYNLSLGEEAIYKRVIHASGDPALASDLKMSEDFVTRGVEALKIGCKIITDVRMIEVGINKKNTAIFKNEVICSINEPKVAEEAKRLQTTRAKTAIDLLKDSINNNIIVVGNAPTALFEVLRLVVEEGLQPKIIVGVPVGFVGASESKAQIIKLAPLLREKGIGWISLQGTKGGSPIAVAIINALLIQGVKEKDE